jgi:hypothetical protein
MQKSKLPRQRVRSHPPLLVRLHKNIKLASGQTWDDFPDVVLTLLHRRLERDLHPVLQVVHWLWQPKDRRVLMPDGSRIPVSTLLYEWMWGPFTTKLMRICSHTQCVNPYHHEPGAGPGVAPKEPNQVEIGRTTGLYIPAPGQAQPALPLIACNTLSDEELQELANILDGLLDRPRTMAELLALMHDCYTADEVHAAAPLLTQPTRERILA